MIIGLVLISSVIALITSTATAIVMGFGFLAWFGLYAAIGLASTLGLAVSRVYLCPLVNAALRGRGDRSAYDDHAGWGSEPSLVRQRD